MTGATVTPSLFAVLGVPPAVGRTFTDEEGQPGSQRVTILSHSFWQQRLGGDPDVLGTVLTLDDEPHTVVGVMPVTFQFPPDQDVDLWTPLSIPTRLLPVRAMRVYNVVGRLAPGVERDLAQTELRALAAEIAAEYPQDEQWVDGVGHASP